MKRILYILSVFTIFASFFVVMFSSCGEFAERRMKGVVAECEGKQLTERDLRPLTRGLSAEDSIRVVEHHIRQWCINLQMEKTIGKESMGKKKQEIERLVEDYRRSLYAYEWERYLVSREMSQHVVDTVVLAYYEAHKEKFVLRETILRGALLVVPNQAPGLDKVKKQLAQLASAQVQMQGDEQVEVLEQLEKYAYQNASGYELFLEEWKTASQILLRMPFEEDNLHKLLKQKRQVSMQDSLNTYVLQVSEMYVRGEQMPLDFARGEIEKIILSQRQVEFIQQKREEIYKEALEQGKLKLYEK